MMTLEAQDGKAIIYAGVQAQWVACSQATMIIACALILGSVVPSQQRHGSH